MRFLTIAGAALVLLLPAITSAKACGEKMHSTQITTTDYSAETDKTKPVKKVAKKHHKPKAPKVEYMRAAPM